MHSYIADTHRTALSEKYGGYFDSWTVELWNFLISVQVSK